MKPALIQQDHRPNLQKMAQQVALLKNKSAKEHQVHLLCSALIVLMGRRL